MLTGHAGMFITSGSTTVLCDPWFNPAYLGSWVPFPDNSGIDHQSISHPTYLYVSHLHKDHFDAEYLSRHISKDTTVLLPDFPLDELREAFEALGFTSFIQTKHGVGVDLEGISATVWTATTPHDGPLGDSALVLGDGRVRVLNQNDCHLPDVSGIGPVDLHMLQYSGAIWYPMVYDYPADKMAELSIAKRANQLKRATRYIEAVGARDVIPAAGPPAFLDDPLFELNDFGDDTNIFLDQTAYITYLNDRGHHNALLMAAGSVADVSPTATTVTHPEQGALLDRAFGTNKRQYLEDYKLRVQPRIDAIKATWPTDGAPVKDALKAWFEPLMERAPRVCGAMRAPVLMEVGTESVLIDPGARQVRHYDSEEWGHRFVISSPIIRHLIDQHCQDWVNELFLSCRFEASRQGDYNGIVFQFFKCLSPERMDYLEASLAPPTRSPASERIAKRAQAEEGETWRFGDYVVARRCPHLGGDLSRFGECDGRTVTCTLHGWSFDLQTGRCTNAESDAHLQTSYQPEAGEGGS